MGRLDRSISSGSGESGHPRTVPGCRYRAVVARRSALVLALTLFAAACGGESTDPGKDPGRELVRIGADERSHPFEAPGPWRVVTATQEYCAVSVLEEPGGDRVASQWAESGFVIDIEAPGQFSLVSSGCDSVRAVLD